MNYLWIGLGAAAGGMTRYWMAGIVQRLFPTMMPLGTLSVNVVGGFLIGILMFHLDTGNMISPTMKLLLGVGFCGGLTTFSSFSFETMNLLIDSEYFYAISNILLNIFFSLAATSLGLLLSKLLGDFYGN